MKKALVTGCSMTSGFMMNPDVNAKTHEYPQHPKLWCNQLLQYMGFTNIVNNASTGANNQTIFQKTVESLMSDRYDTILVQWSDLARLNQHIGLEMYQTRTMFKNSHDINLVNHITISRKSLDNIGEKIHALTNLHWNILELVQYVNVLKELQESRGGNIFFVNGLCSWSDNYFNRVPDPEPANLSSFLQEILQIDHRDDAEIFQLYNLIYDQYEKNRGMQEQNWLNLYDSLASRKVDSIRPNDFHPGFASQDMYFSYLKEQLK